METPCPVPDAATARALEVPRPAEAPFPVEVTPEREAIVGSTAELLEVLQVVRKVAMTTSTVLITGESGSGKELIARAIHFTSEATRSKRFVPVNCAAIPDNLLESELFGYVRGAFTGARLDKLGLFEVADGGSIFLDEIGEMTPTLQAKLLRAIETKEILRIGGTDTIRINARIICSTNRDLEQMVAENKFREDLFYRINVVEVRMPPLRKRREDIPLLVKYFLEKYNRILKMGYRSVDPAAMRALLAYDWKGNIRELENVIERAMILGNGAAISLRELPPAISNITPAVDTLDLREAVRDFERRHIISVLKSTEGDKAEAAKRLGIGLSSLYRKLEELAPQPQT